MFFSPSQVDPHYTFKCPSSDSGCYYAHQLVNIPQSPAIPSCAAMAPYDCNWFRKHLSSKSCDLPPTTSPPPTEKVTTRTANGPSNFNATNTVKVARVSEKKLNIPVLEVVIASLLFTVILACIFVFLCWRRLSHRKKYNDDILDIGPFLVIPSKSNCSSQLLLFLELFNTSFIY